MAQVRRLGRRVGGRLALFCIHRVNRVYGALVVTSWTCYKLSYIIIIIIIIIINLYSASKAEIRLNVYIRATPRDQEDISAGSRWRSPPPLATRSVASSTDHRHVTSPQPEPEANCQRNEMAEVERRNVL